MISIKELNTRKDKILADLEDFSVVILFSGRAKTCSSDESYPFRGNRNFFYLTNVEQEDSILILTKKPQETNAYIFVQPYSELKEKWTGIRLKPEEVKNISGIENVLSYDNFDAKFDMIISEFSSITSQVSVYLDLEKELKIKESYTTNELKIDLKNKYNNIVIRNIYENIMPLRMIKSHDEIEDLKEAIKITNHGLLSVLNILKPNIKEYQIKAMFEYTIRDLANCNTSFSTIAASGKNATILHYPSPIDSLHANELMLLDLGACYEGYNADISRTYPISGKYEGIAAQLYDIVLGANKNVIDICRPGLTIEDLQNSTIQYLTKGLLTLGLIKDPDEIKKYYFHNVSHHIGLDTHDPSERKLPLVSGNIISDEPGLYIKELGIGIRIEDDILVTDNGCVCLSGDIAKERKDIERLIASRK